MDPYCFLLYLPAATEPQLVATVYRKSGNLCVCLYHAYLYEVS